MTRRRRGIARASLAMVAIIVIVVATIGYTALLSQPNSNSSQNSTTTRTTTTTTPNQTRTIVSNSGQLGPWENTTVYPGRTPGSCVISTGDIYCLGGGDNATYYAIVSSSGVGQWTRTTDYPIAIQDAGCVESSNYIYCVGGTSSQSTDKYGRTADVFYAPLSSLGIGAWTESTSFPYIAASPRCMVSFSTVYCIEGGVNAGSYNDTGEVYHASLSASGVGSWVQSTSMQSITAGCSAVDGYAYCFGGGGCSPIPNSDCYSPSYSSPLSPNGVGLWNNASELPTAGWANYVTAGSYIYYFSIPVFYANVSAGQIGEWETTTNFPDSGYPAACASSASYIYCVSGNNDAVYYTQVGAPNPNALVLLNPPPFPRAEYLGPAWSGSGGCSVSVNGTFAGAPCFDYNIDNAMIFNCAASAATSSGCKTTVVSPTNTAYDYNITIWYPHINASVPDTNCAFQPALGYGEPFYAWCISVSQNSFIIAQQIQMQSGQTGGCAIAPPYCPGLPMVTADWLSGPYEVPYNLTCSLASGTCTVVLVNNGTSSEYDARTVGCQITVITAKNSTITTVDSVMGVNAGPAATDIPVGMKSIGTCAVPTSDLSLMTKGTYANGCFQVTLVSQPTKQASACFYEDSGWS